MANGNPAAGTKCAGRTAVGRLSAHASVLRLGPEGVERGADQLAVEEPLELRVDGRPLAVTMRTPGHDVELARYCDSLDEQGRNTYNVLDVTLGPGVAAPDASVQRNFYTTSSCGVCG